MAEISGSAVLCFCTFCFDLWSLGCTFMYVHWVSPSVCTCLAYRRALSVFLADCPRPLEAPYYDRSGGGGRCLKNHWRALILLIRPERDVAFPHNYLHTVNLSLGGPSKPNPQRHGAISRMRREERMLRCRLMLLSARIRLHGASPDVKKVLHNRRWGWKVTLQLVCHVFLGFTKK